MTKRKWQQVAQKLSGRSYAGCAKRWINRVDPSLCKDPWSEKEDRILLEAQAKLGNKWLAISELLPGRSGGNAYERSLVLSAAAKKKLANGKATGSLVADNGPLIEMNVIAATVD